MHRRYLRFQGRLHIDREVCLTEQLRERLDALLILSDFILDDRRRRAVAAEEEVRPEAARLYLRLGIRRRANRSINLLRDLRHLLPDAAKKRLRGKERMHRETHFVRVLHDAPIRGRGACILLVKLLLAHLDHLLKLRERKRLRRRALKVEEEVFSEHFARPLAHVL